MVNLGAADRAHGAAIRRSPLKKLYVQVLIAIGVGIAVMPEAGPVTTASHDIASAGPAGYF